MSKGWEGGSSWAQRKQRAEVILRDGGQCQLRLEGCEVYATQSHHKLGIAVSGKVVKDLAELEAACESCNRKVSDPTKGADPDPEPRTQW